jgi:phage-related baseplate assembly protein
MTSGAAPESAHETVPGRGPEPQQAPGPAGPSAVASLVSRLDGLERRPLPAQVEVLDAVRRGLDEELARPVTDG